MRALIDLSDLHALHACMKFTRVSFRLISCDTLGCIGLDVIVISGIIVLVEAGSAEGTGSTFRVYGLSRRNDNASFQVDLCICCVRHFLKILDIHVEDAAAQAFLC